MKCVASGDSLAATTASGWLLLQPWGEHGIRLRAGQGLPSLPPEGWPSALIGAPSGSWQWGQDERHVWLSCGRLRLEVDQQGRWLARDLERNFELTAERVPRVYGSGAMPATTMTLRAHDDECFYGLGQHPSGALNLKGQVIDLQQRNGTVSVPFLVSSRGYGLLWNMAAYGRIELATNHSRFVADAAPCVDLWLTAAPTLAELLLHYHQVTGFAPELPDWALGFWQSKLRYASQAELLWVAAEYRRRNLPLGAIVVDYFHWPQMGAFCFDSNDWPDPAALVATLHDWGTALVVSTWPTINRNSPAFATLQAMGGLVRTQGGGWAVTDFMDNGSEGNQALALYDPSLAAARQWMAEQCARGYLMHGVDGLWLDACEPEISIHDPASWSLAAGQGNAVGLAYPWWHQQAFADHQPRPGLMLCRSAWAGSQRFGAAVWSGDIASSFASLRCQIAAGLNMAMAGISWWTTDIGGFYGGHGDDPAFHELLLRWFQYGLFCPLMRLHGKREPGNDRMGAANEIWSFGAAMETRLSRLIRIRQRLKAYLRLQFSRYQTQGVPIMRPLCFDFSQDPAGYVIADQFMCGPELLICPVVEAGARSRRLWLPSGCRWLKQGSEDWLDGGQWLTLPFGLDDLPLLIREGSELADSEYWQ